MTIDLEDCNYLVMFCHSTGMSTIALTSQPYDANNPAMFSRESKIDALLFAKELMDDWLNERQKLISEKHRSNREFLRI